MLLAAQGWSNAAIAQEVGCVEDTARKWRGRFSPQRGLASLEDNDRSGRPPRVHPEDRAALIKLACDRPKDELTWRILGFIGRYNRLDARPFRWKFRGTFNGSARRRAA